MEKTVVFDADWVRRYCKLVGDDNGVHNLDYMRSQIEVSKIMEIIGGKLKVVGERERCRQVIVPGFMVISSFGDMLVDSFRNGADYLDVNIGSFLCEEDKAKLEVLPHGKRANRLVVSGDEGSDIFTSSGLRSTLSGIDASYFHVENTNVVNIPVSFDKMNEFGELMGIEHKGVRDTMFGLSLISQALLYRVRNPVCDVGRELNEVFCQETDGTKRMVPAYLSVRAFLPSRDQLQINQGNLEFSFVGRKGDRKRSYHFDVWCKQGNLPILGAKLDLLTFKEKALVKGARYSTVDNGSMQ